MNLLTGIQRNADESKSGTIFENINFQKCAKATGFNAADVAAKVTHWYNIGGIVN